jgi:hypothetical protein
MANPRTQQTLTDPPIDEAEYNTLKTDLTNPTSPFDTIQPRLNPLPPACLHSLFGHIRKAFIDVLWQQRELELWMFRSRHLGSEYAQAQCVTPSSSTALNRYYFARWMDDRLKMGPGEKPELVEMGVKHVTLFRESRQIVRELREEKQRVLASGRV